MKKSLGRVAFILFIFFIYADANNLASYSISANKTEVYEKEAITITFSAIQQDHTDNMMFSLKPKKSDDYKIILLNKKIDDKKYHNSHTSFKYLLFPMKAKKISIDFDFIIRTASDKTVAQSYVDDHDGSIGIQTSNKKVKIKPLEIKVKKLKQHVDLVGDFSLKESVQQTQINQYESLNIVYTLLGEGFGGSNIQLIKNIKNTTIFSEINNVYLKPTQNGYKIKKEYIYALSAKDNFMIPQVTLQAYSPKRGKYYKLTTPNHQITVTKIDASKLLDNEEYPTSKDFIKIDTIKQLFIYILIFVSGFFSAKFQSFNFNGRIDTKEFKEIKKTKNPKELLFALVNNNKESKFTKEVKMLEDMIYNNATHNFIKIKNRILKGLQ